MASGFGLPTRLLETPSTSVLPISPLTGFRFQSIGQQPRLLARFTDSNQAQDGTEDESTSSDSDQKQQDAERSTTPRSRPLLWQTLVEQEPTTSNNLTGQASANTSVTSTSLEQQLGLAKGGQVSQPDNFSLPSSSHIASQPADFDGNAVHQISDDSLAHMDLGHPSVGLGVAPMEDIQSSHPPVSPSSPPTSQKYGCLRQIHSRLVKISLTSDHKPNLTSAILLSNSAQQKADAAYVKVRMFHRSTQELLQGAFRAHAEASALLKDIEEAKGLADGAKAEIERISSAYVDQKSQSNHSEIKELLQLLENCIAEQEANKAVLRAQELELKQQKVDPAGASAQLSAQSSSSSSLSVTDPATSATSSISISASQKQPLFYSPTPDIDIKIDHRIWPQPPLHPSPAPALGGFRKPSKEKHRLSDEESSAPSSLDAVHEQQRQLEEEWQASSSEDRRKHFKEERTRGEEQDKRKGELRRIEEHGQGREEEGKKHEEIKRRSREEVAKIAREEETHVRKEAEKKRVYESLGTADRIRAEIDRKKILEEAERRTGEAQGRRKAQEEEVAKKEEVREEELAKRNSQEEAWKKRSAIQHQQQGQGSQPELHRAQEEAMEEKILQDMRCARIQEEKDKTLADRAQRILAQRSQSPLHGTSELSPDLSLTIPAPTTSNALPASQSKRSPSAAIPPSQQTPTFSVHSSSRNSGNVPYRESNLHSTSSQVQAANIRHVVNALNLQPPTLVKTEPAHDDDHKLLYPPSRDRTPQHQISREFIQKPASQSSHTHIPDLQPQQSTVPLPASASRPSLSAEPTNGSHAHIILGHRIPSSPATTEIPHSHLHQSQQLHQIGTAVDPTPGRPRTQVPNQSVSIPSTQPHRSVCRNEARRKFISSSGSQISGRSRSSSPFRMGPDACVAPQITADFSPSGTPPDMPTGSAPFCGQLRLPTPIPPVHYGHYTPPPQRSRSPPIVSPPRSPPPIQTDTHRPKYAERARSPVLIGRKRSRENSPGPYKRDYGDRRAPPVRNSRTPPLLLQSRRTTSRSRSPSPGSAPSRPSLATRLGQGPQLSSDHSYRLPTAPLRDRERDREPHLLSRFSDARTAGFPPSRGRARGKRGRGGGPINSHASLEERISS